MLENADIIIEKKQVICMMWAQIENCRVCGRLFLKDHSDYCLDCYKEIEIEFNRVVEFLKNENNHDATIEEVSANTDVQIKRITYFIREGRIFADDFPNLGYGCAYCGKLIKKQVLCNNCFEQLSSDIDRTLKKDELEQEILFNQRSNIKESQYWRLKRDK